MAHISHITKDIPWYGHCCRWLLRLACGALLGVATYRALALLPSPLVELQRLGFVDSLPVSPVVVHLGVATLAGVLYALLPPLGGVVALASLLLPMAFLHVGLAGVYAVLALLCLPCLAKREGVLILALIPLALANPAFALLLPLIPVLAGLLNGRFLGPYTAFVAALVLIVLGLIAGQATVPALSDGLSLSKGGVEGGSVAISGDRDPLMASEDIVFVTENMPLMPPQLTEGTGFVEDLREAVREGDVGTIAAWLFLMLQWWGPTCLIGTIFAFTELIPRLLVFHLIALLVLWGAVAATAAWGAWLIAEKSVTRWMLQVIYVVIGGVALTAVTAAGHSILAAMFG
jgi:hypothetical protein